MSSKQRSTRLFDRLMRQALHEIASYRPTACPHRPPGHLSVDDIDSVRPQELPRGQARPPRATPRRPGRLDRFRHQRPPRFKRYLQVRP